MSEQSVKIEKKSIGKCPHCGGEMYFGKFGPYCEEKCGFYLKKVFGNEITEEQAKDLLNGKKILIEGLVSKKSGSTYSMFYQPDGIEDYSYVGKDGVERTGQRFKYITSFPEDKKKSS